ncbi:MAG: hypothetical protein Q8M43_00320 [Sulfuricurvum sp.]|nr:hypothetical protein [Sulfuricurvum sp.]MDP2851346.1 hypothetical protein [Sulfuricurvum sp.]MDP3290457.1 hypothetical protein [Sulfuricurvum sp.]
MRILFLFFIGFFIAEADQSFLVNTHIRMLPKIMALDTHLASKAASSKIIFAIVYDSNKKANAQSIADEMNRVHNGKISTISFTAVALSVEELMVRKETAFVYLIQQCNSQSVKKVAAWGIANTVPTFSYDVNDLEFGILGSISVERSTIVYINKNTLKEGKFRFNDTLFQIARLVE